ncbi:hypothetical protein KKG46_00600, partial [Patescibacteria group bacterium]|nr:hypothetical protein [Patescibacteria group bacterium]
MNTPNANQVHITILDRDKIIESGTCSLAYVLFRVLNASQQVVSVEFNYTLTLYTRDDDIIRVASPERDVLERILTAHQDSTGDVTYDWMRFFDVSHGTAFKFRHVA